MVADPVDGRTIDPPRGRRTDTPRRRELTALAGGALDPVTGDANRIVTRRGPGDRDRAAIIVQLVTGRHARGRRERRQRRQELEHRDLAAAGRDREGSSREHRDVDRIHELPGSVAEPSHRSSNTTVFAEDCDFAGVAVADHKPLCRAVPGHALRSHEDRVVAEGGHERPGRVKQQHPREAGVGDGQSGSGHRDPGREPQPAVADRAESSPVRRRHDQETRRLRIADHKLSRIRSDGQVIRQRSLDGEVADSIATWGPDGNALRSALENIELVARRSDGHGICELRPLPRDLPRHRRDGGQDSRRPVSHQHAAIEQSGGARGTNLADGDGAEIRSDLDGDVRLRRCGWTAGRCDGATDRGRYCGARGGPASCGIARTGVRDRPCVSGERVSQRAVQRIPRDDAHLHHSSHRDGPRRESERVDDWRPRIRDRDRK